MKKILLALMTIGVSLAQLPMAPYLTNDIAIQIAQTAQKYCKKKGFNVTTTVVDSKGVILAVSRNENAGMHTVQASFKKAYTAVSMKNNTAQIAKNIANGKAPKGLINLNDNFVFLGGGVVIKAQNYIIGSVGVGGAPSGDTDAECADFGIQSVRNLLQ